MAYLTDATIVYENITFELEWYSAFVNDNEFDHSFINLYLHLFGICSMPDTAF